MARRLRVHLHTVSRKYPSIHHAPEAQHSKITAGRLQPVEAAPASRRMDMARIANVMVFGNAPTASGTLFVSRIWLERVAATVERL